MEFNYDFERKSKHKIKKIEELLEPECRCKMNGLRAIDFKLVNEERIKTSNKKLQNYFLNNYTCERCGAKGEFFALERNKGSNKYFLNLYTIKNGQEILMLKELRVPTKLGGFDIPENWILICDECYLNDFRNQKQELISASTDCGYILIYNEPNNKKYVNITKNKFGQLLCTYVENLSKAKIYKNKGLLKNRLNKMIEQGLLPTTDITRYKIKLKDREERKTLI